MTAAAAKVCISFLWPTNSKWDSKYHEGGEKEKKRNSAKSGKMNGSCCCYDVMSLEPRFRYSTVTRCNNNIFDDTFTPHCCVPWKVNLWGGFVSSQEKERPRSQKERAGDGCWGSTTSRRREKKRPDTLNKPVSGHARFTRNVAAARPRPLYFRCFTLRGPCLLPEPTSRPLGRGVGFTARSLDFPALWARAGLLPCLEAVAHS